jgi:hypothetical protein
MFLQYLFQNSVIDTGKKLAELSTPIEEIGKMLYGWKRNIETKKKLP